MAKVVKENPGIKIETAKQANEVEQANETEPAVAKPVKKSKILSAFEYILRFLFRH